MSNFKYNSKECCTSIGDMQSTMNRLHNLSLRSSLHSIPTHASPTHASSNTLTKDVRTSGETEESNDEEGSGAKRGYNYTPKSSSSMPKLVVWDFDLTLTNIHTWYAGLLSVDKVQTLESGHVRDKIFADFQFFKETVETLHNTGVKVGIATFQYSEVVKALLDKAYGIDEAGFSLNPFKESDILGRLFVCRDKLKMLRHLAKKNGIPFDQSEIWFFDDDNRNVSRVQKCSQQENANLKAFLVDDGVHFVREAYGMLFNGLFNELFNENFKSSRLDNSESIESPSMHRKKLTVSTDNFDTNTGKVQNLDKILYASFEDLSTSSELVCK